MPASEPKPESTAKPKAKSSLGKPDLITFGGLLLAIGGITGGLILEGGSVRDVTQVTAAIIVLSGTIGAVMVTTPAAALRGALMKLKYVFFTGTNDSGAAMEQVIEYATQARRDGIVSLEKQANLIQDPFLKKALNLAVDGTDLQQIKKIMELEISTFEQEGEAEAKVFEAAGGYAPTIGIIGAVLGLIQVMKNLADIDEVGHGIAVAFVATVYGVGVANIFFLPAANKIKARLHEQVQTKELMLEGVLGIVEGLNPRLIRSKLEGFGSEPAAKESKAKGKDAKGKTKEAKPVAEAAAVEG